MIAPVEKTTQPMGMNEVVSIFSKEKKLDLRDIFSKMGEYVCQVTTLRGRCSGIFIGNKLVLVPFHAIALQKIAELDGGNSTFKIFTIEISHQGTTYTAQYASLGSLDVAHYYDCCVFEVIDDDFTPITSHACYFDTPVPGEKIYFASYPLTQRTASFHKGIVSSVDELEETVCFNIDAVVLPGSSGGPVFTVRDGKLYMTGIIFAELAHIDSQFARERQAIGQQLGLGGLSLSGIDLCKVMNNMLDTVFDNLATGIGKVISIKHVNDLLTKKDVPDYPSPFHIGLPVLKTEKLPGNLGKDPTYLEWWHREVKPNKSFCASIVGKSYDAIDQIDKEEEKLLRAYYEINVVNDPHKGHQQFEQSLADKYRTLERKIFAAKPKVLKQHKLKWESLLLEYEKDLPEEYKEKIQNLILTLNKS